MNQLYQEIPLSTLAEHVYNMQTRGYSVFEDFLDEDMCELLKDRYLSVLNSYQHYSTERSKVDKHHIHDLLVQDVEFAKLLEDPRLQQIFAPILGEYWIMYAFTTSSIPPHGGNYGGRVHVDCPRFIQNYVTNAGIIWALDDFTTENGGTKLLPASHHSVEIPSESFFEQHCIQLSCKKGTAIVFNARVVHRAGFNKTDAWRHSLTMNVCRPYMKQRMDWVRFIPENISSQLNQQARRIIGFDTRLPSSLEEFFVPEEQRLYKPNQE
jgi:hypothetical protein